MALLHTQSEAVFKQRAEEFGLTATHITNMKTKGWKTVGALAHAAAFNPEHPDEKVFLDKIARHVLPWDLNGDEPLHTNNLRQFYWDCLQADMAETRARHDPRVDINTIKLPKQDRLDRRKAIKTAMRDHLPEIEDAEFDPAWAPEDDLVAMYAEDQLGDYMGPEMFPTRRQEKLWQKKNKKPRAVAAGANLWKMITGE